MSATTTQYVYERIYEVLVDGNGTSRKLATGERFARGFPPGFDPAMRATRAKLRPDGEVKVGSVFVVIGALQVEGFAAGEMSDSHLYRTKVVLYRDHWLGFEGSPTQVESQLVAASDAFMKVRAALCFPGNLKQTEEGNATGLAGEALNGANAKTGLVSVDNLGGNARLLQFRDEFEAEFDFNPGS